jgi:hypothetical protein
VKGDERGASELIDETLIIAMGLVLAVVIGMLMFGVIPLTEKTAYLVPQFSLMNVSDKSVISIFDRGGEPVYLAGTPQAKFRAELYVDTQSGSYRAVPVSSLPVFKPGDRVFAYYTGTGFVLTNTLSGATFQTLPAGKITVRFIDATSGVLIAKEDLVKGMATATTTTAPATTTTSVTTTTTSTTTTTTTTASTHTIHVSWSPSGLGDVSPPGGHGGGASVIVTDGASQTFVCTPNQHSNKAVRSVVADGVTIYSGSSADIPFSTSFNNVVADHTLVVTFGNAA